MLASLPVGDVFVQILMNRLECGPGNCPNEIEAVPLSSWKIALGKGYLSKVLLHVQQVL